MVRGRDDGGTVAAAMAALRCIGTLVALTAGCAPVAIDPAGRPCKEGECARGWVCHPERGTCVPRIAVGCSEADQICPSEVPSRVMLPASNWSSGISIIRLSWYM